VTSILEPFPFFLGDPSVQKQYKELSLVLQNNALVQATLAVQTDVATASSTETKTYLGSTVPSGVFRGAAWMRWMLTRNGFQGTQLSAQLTLRGVFSLVGMECDAEVVSNYTSRGKA
jgi:hypothetical protein